MELTKIQFEDGQKVSDAYVEINGVKHPVVKAQYQGKTPLSARNLNKMQENMETAISDLDERVVSYRNVLVDKQALIKECGGLKLKKLNKLVGKTEQEVRSGKNLLNSSSFEGAYYTIDGNITSKNTNALFDYISVNSNTKYTLSVKENIFGLVFVEFDENKKFILRTQILNTNKNTITTNSKTKYIRCVVNKDDVTAMTNTIVDNLKPQLELGEVRTEYEAYGKAPTPNFPSEVKTVTGNVEVDIDNGNMFDFQKWVDNGVTVNAGTTEIVGNGIKITSTSADTFTMTYSENFTVGGDGTNSVNKYGFKIQPSTIYRITADVVNNINRQVYVFFYDKDKKFIKYDGTYATNSNSYKITYKFTTPENAEYVCIRFGIQVKGATEIFSNIRLNRGETDLGYVEHQSQVKTISLGDIELCKIGDYADYIYRAGSKWFKKDNVGKYIVTGDEDFVLATEGFWIAFSQAKSIYKAYCNYYENYTNYSALVGQEKGFAFMYGNLYIRNKDYANATDFKAHLKELYDNGTPVIIYYPLATPTDTEILNARLIAQLSALEHIKLYEGITNITITGDNLTPIADIDYWTWFKGESADTSNIYSTEEQVIGKWIDGKPLYRKVVEYNYATANTQVNIPPNLTNPKEIINFDYILDTGSAYMKNFGSDVTFYMSNTNIVYKATSWTGTVRIIIDYTKTTDV